jgi:hypothetical protein
MRSPQRSIDQRARFQLANPGNLASRTPERPQPRLAVAIAHPGISA